jgi:formate C-acetyltransferase
MQNTAEKIEISGLPPRIERMKESFLKVKPSVSIARAKATTEIYKANPNLPVKILRAQAFYRACQTIPVHIGEDELIVGSPSGKQRAGVFCPEISWRWMEAELDTIHQRNQDPYIIDKEDKKVLQEEIFPFWRGRSIDEKIYAQLEDLGILPLTFESGIIDAELKATNGAGEYAPGYCNILIKKGFNGIKKDARKQLKQFDIANPDDVESIYFLKSVIIACDAMVLLGKRYAKRAKQMADKETNPVRKKELETIAEVCSRIPGKPPETFHEALQMVWFGQVAHFLEENAPSYSPGRIDQYFLPYFEKDLTDGTLTQEEAKELLYCFLLKFNEVPWLLNEFASMYYAGYMAFQNICVGGQKPEGGDATNELSYMVLDCAQNLQLYQPSYAARIHNKSPQAYLNKIGEVVKTGIGFPANHFDDTTIKMLLSYGVDPADAKDYCLVGCVEPGISGRLYQWSAVCLTNFPIAVEFALTNGIQLVSGKKLGLETGSPESFKTFEAFEGAVKKQLQHIIRVSAITTVITQQAHRDHLPKPIVSSVVEGCVKSGKDVMMGGAKYNSGPGVIIAGTADYANSMAAVKKLVYEDQSVTMAQLSEAMAKNFEGYETIHKLCKEAPKYGNDDDYVDDFARDLIDFISKEIKSYRGLYSPLALGTLPVSSHTPQGLVVGALPSGRKATLPLADGISPAQGTDVSGPTAIIKSLDKINQEVSTVGVLHNMKLDPGMMADDRGISNFTSLLRTHNQLGGAQIQFNCVNAAKLVEAQQNPEAHRSLMVRVAGYSAFFVELCKEIQDEIISRSPQGKWQ